MSRWRGGGLLGTRVGKRVLGLFVVFGVAPAVLTLALADWRVRDALVAQHFKRVGETVEALGLTVWDRLRIADEIAAEQLDARRPDAAGLFTNTAFDAVLALGQNRTVVHHLAGETVPAALLDPATWRDAPLPKGRDGSVVTLAEPGGLRVWLLRPLPAGAPEGPNAMAALRLRPTFLWQRDDELGTDSELCVFDHLNRPLRCTSPLPQAASRTLAQAWQHKPTGRFEWDGAVPMVGVYREVFLKGRFHSPSWNVVLSQPADAALAPAQRLREVIWPGAFIALMSALLLAIGQVRRTLGPLRALTQATEHLAARDFSHRVSVAARNEFAVLGEAFNRMTEGLSRQFDTMESLSAIDRVILEARSLDEIGSLGVDLLQRALGTPIVGLLLEAQAQAGWRLYLGESALDLLPVTMRGAARPGSRPGIVWLPTARPAVARHADLPGRDALVEITRLVEPNTLLGFVSRQVDGLHLQRIDTTDGLVGLVIVGWSPAQTPTPEAREIVSALVGRTAVAIAAARRERLLNHRAHFDALTGLPNRPHFLERLDAQLTAATARAESVAVLFVDLDGFSQINDTLGHETGDVMLGMVGQRLQATIGERGLVARLGGDEFAIALHCPAGQAPEDMRESVGAQARAVIEALSTPYSLNGTPQFINASIGIACFPADGGNADTLLRHADLAMYRAKATGRGSFHFFETQMNEEVQLRARIEAELRTALQENQFLLHFEPLVAARSGTVLGAEVLVRWSHPTRGQVSPGQFIPVAEETGLIVPIGSWVLREACAQYMRWRAANLPLAVISVNVSVRQFQRPDFVDEVRDVLRATGMPASSLKLELTETLLMGESIGVEHTLEGLASMGVSLALDDFGTGYSSLTYLKRLPVHTIKLDRSFVRDLQEREDARELARSAIAMVHALRKQVVAEGVETPEQRAMLAAWGCDLLQGWLFTRSLPADAFERFVRSEAPAPIDIEPPASVPLARQAESLEQSLKLLRAVEVDDELAAAPRTDVQADLGRQGVGEPIL